MTLKQALVHGLWKDLPPFRLVLGLCPALAVTSSAENGLGMGLAATFVLVFSNMFISVLRKVIPDKVRIGSFIVVIATLVVLVEMIMKAYFFPLSQQLGIFIPLIVVNCIILGRAEAFASKNKIPNAIMDALGMGIGFGIAITIISFLRQILGTGNLAVFGNDVFQVPGISENPMPIFILPMGAFLVISLLLATLRYFGVISSG